MKLFLLIIIGVYLYSNDSGYKQKSIDINFVILTKNKTVHEKVTLEHLKNEVIILNKYFVSENRTKLINFKFKNAYFYNEIKKSKCEFLKYGDIKQYKSEEVSKLYWKCKDKRIRDPFAINFYVVDSYSKKNGYKSGTSHGKNAGNHPFVLIDWERLNHTGQSPEEHEMGHSFGLIHICYDKAKRSSNTNIMASAGNCSGSGGKRNIGFSQWQVKKIYSTYEKVLRRFEKNNRLLK